MSDPRAPDAASFRAALFSVAEAACSRFEHLADLPTVAPPAALDAALESLPTNLPDAGLGLDATTDLLLAKIAPATSAYNSRFFGFVTGGLLPAAQVADNLATALDVNVQVNLHRETIATWVEHAAVRLVLDLLGLDQHRFTGRTLTTGATASNIVGLALGREHAVKRIKGESWSVAEDGFGGIDVEVFAAGAHASTTKAAAVVGIGRRRVREIRPDDDSAGCTFDLDMLEQALAGSAQAGRGAIVVASYGEVNTGCFTPDMPRIRQLCDRYGAWLHLDAAFGAFAALHPSDFEFISDGLQAADSITLDAHKWLNVPYDCGILLARQQTHLTDVFGPGRGPAPAYLAAGDAKGSADDSGLAALQAESAALPSHLHVRSENSSRFRGLPLYAALLSIGRQGYVEMVTRTIAFARAVAEWLEVSELYDLLNSPAQPISNIVLFASRHVDSAIAVARIKATGRVYVSPTAWRGRSAIRLAVSHYAASIENDLAIVTEVLHTAAQPSQY